MTNPPVHYGSQNDEHPSDRERLAHAQAIDAATALLDRLDVEPSSVPIVIQTLLQEPERWLPRVPTDDEMRDNLERRSYADRVQGAADALAHFWRAVAETSPV